MANAQLAPVLRHIGRMVDPQATKDLTDAELLERYTAQHDEAAFTTILHRYGRLVLARCRRVLHHEQNAEDAFQATFLILARKAASIRKRDALASWLYRVASHIAMKAKKEASRRRNHERGALGVPKDNPHSDLALQELQEVLDEELQRLPETYRLPFVLCCLNGQSKTEAARHLGWKEGTVSGRLARARKLLQQRLSTRGVALSAGLAAAALSQSATGAGVPAALTADTIQAALLYGAGKTVPAGLLSRTVIGLLHGVTSTMFVSKCKLATALLLAIGFFATGAGMLMHAVPVAITLVEGEEQPGQEATQAPAKAESQQPARADRQGDALPPGAVVRLGTLRFRHDSWVESVAVSSEGKLIAGGGAGRVRLWDGATGKELRWFDLPRGVATPVALSPDGKLLATGGGDHVIRLWDPASGNLLHELIGHEALPVDPLVGRPIGILKIAFAPGGKTLASLGADRTIRLWESATARQLHQLKAPTGDIPFGMSLAFSPDGKALAAGGERVGKPNLLVVWDAGTGKELRRWKPPSAVLSLAWSPDGKILATAASDPKNKAGITLWDAATGLKLRCLTGQENPVSVRFSSDGKTVASAGGYPDSTLRLWDAASGRAIRQISTTAAGNFGIDFLDGDRVLLSWGTANTVYFWDVRTGRPLRRFAGHASQVFDVAFSPDGKMVATAGGNDEEVGLWDAASGKQIGRLKEESQERSNATAVVFSPKNQVLAAANSDGAIRLWQLSTRNLLCRLRVPRGWVKALAFSRDGKLLAAPNEDRTIRVWNVSSGKEVWQWPWDSGHPIDSLAFSPDGRTLAAGAESGRKGGYSVRTWDVTTGSELSLLRQTDSSAVTSLAYSPDGRMLVASRTDDEVRLWELATGQERLRIKHPGRVTSIALSPDGRIVASAYVGDHGRATAGKPQGPANEQGEVIRLWDVFTGREIHRFVGHRGGVMALAFSPDGKQLASAGKDTTALLWDVQAVRKAMRLERTKHLQEELRALWTDLGGTDAGKAFRAVGKMVGDPAQSIPFLKRHLRPVESVDAERLGLLLADLDSKIFARREKAQTELEQMGARAEPALQQALKMRPSVEVRRRVEKLLQKLETGRLPEQRQQRRALEVLEHIGSTEARQVLKSLAAGAEHAWLTEEAKAALRHLGTRAAVIP